MYYYIKSQLSAKDFLRLSCLTACRSRRKAWCGHFPRCSSGRPLRLHSHGKSSRSYRPPRCGFNWGVGRAVKTVCAFGSDRQSVGLQQAEGGDPSAWTANRKAAIEKFRAKRKLRKYDKCVRYESRRRLAEARPRVRGMFVKASVAAAYAAELAAGGVRMSRAKRMSASR